jgi:hypothetical protein
MKHFLLVIGSSMSFFSNQNQILNVFSKLPVIVELLLRLFCL